MRWLILILISLVVAQDMNVPDDNFDVTDEWFLEIRYIVVIVLAGLGLIMSCLTIFACCCFGSTKPPCSYDDIMWNEKTGKFD